MKWYIRGISEGEAMEQHVKGERGINGRIRETRSRKAKRSNTEGSKIEGSETEDFKRQRQRDRERQRDVGSGRKGGACVTSNF